mmetsp:Transcript_44224/g.106574  ORF Transcript_44224/g.106574 Transcript_44224/m.106574 type:complete len:149 (+) Transcript_44224:115-561(+)
MPPSSEPTNDNASIQDFVRMKPVKRSVKFDQNVEFSDKAVGRLAPVEEDEKSARIRARELRHRLRREWSADIDTSSLQPVQESSPAPPVRKRSVGYDTHSKSAAPSCPQRKSSIGVTPIPKSTAPSCPQRKRSIGLTTEDTPMPYRSS